MSRRPKQQQRLQDFFEAAPFEELTMNDVAAKLGCSQRAAAMTVLRMVHKGLLEYAHVVRLTQAQQRKRFSSR